LVSPGFRPLCPDESPPTIARAAAVPVAVGIAEDAINLHRIERPRAGVGDLAIDLDHGLLEVVFRGLHLHVAQLQIRRVGLGFFRERDRPARVARGVFAIAHRPAPSRTSTAMILLATNRHLRMRIVGAASELRNSRSDPI